MGALSEIGDSELIAELYKRNCEERGAFTIDELLANFNFKINAIFNRCVHDLDNLQKETIYEQCKTLYIKGEAFDHLLPDGHYSHFDNVTELKRSIMRGVYPSIWGGIDNE